MHTVVKKRYTVGSSCKLVCFICFVGCLYCLSVSLNFFHIETQVIPCPVIGASFSIGSEAFAC